MPWQKVALYKTVLNRHNCRNHAKTLQRMPLASDPTQLAGEYDISGCTTQSRAHHRNYALGAGGIAREDSSPGR
eukprot:scaffold58377_cov14-Prasinocladus_malaysianus.AAC.1